jgi:hypothetical protein
MVITVLVRRNFADVWKELKGGYMNVVDDVL